MVCKLLKAEYSFNHVIGIEPSASANKIANSIYPENADKLNI